MKYSAKSGGIHGQWNSLYFLFIYKILLQMSGKRRMQLPDSHAHIINYTASRGYIYLKASRCEIEIGPFH